MTEIDRQSWEKLQNLKAALLKATRLEGFDHVQPAVDHLMGYLGAYEHTGREFDVLMGAIHHLAWLLKHKTNEVHALRYMISKLCPSDLATQILEKSDQGMAGPHAARFHCPVCGASRPNQEAPGRRRGTVEVLQRLCDDCIKGEGPLEQQALARKQAAMEALADDEHARRSSKAPLARRSTTDGTTSALHRQRGSRVAGALTTVIASRASQTSYRRTRLFSIGAAARLLENVTEAMDFDAVICCRETCPAAPTCSSVSPSSP